jgi:hypothetical protein
VGKELSEQIQGANSHQKGNKHPEIWCCFVPWQITKYFANMERQIKGCCLATSTVMKAVCKRIYQLLCCVQEGSVMSKQVKDHSETCSSVMYCAAGNGGFPLCLCIILLWSRAAISMTAGQPAALLAVCGLLIHNQYC